MMLEMRVQNTIKDGQKYYFEYEVRFLLSFAFIKRVWYLNKNFLSLKNERFL
jgi:hypothetical protein